MAKGLYRTKTPASGAEYAYVDYGVPSSNGEIPRERYEAQGYAPPFEKLPLKDEYVTENVKRHSALITEYRSEQEKLRDSIKLMEARVMGVGDPITIPEAVNEPTRRFIADLKAGIEELEEATKILRGIPRS